MEIGTTTTPFGRRGAKLSLVRRQVEAENTSSDRSVDKWSVFRDACEARDMLGLQDRPLSVLNALLSFYPHAELCEDKGLVVFPSNVQLSARANGISGATLRRALFALVEAGLIERRDSPNGKRYAHRDTSGAVEKAFGFDLKPLLLRAGELALMAQKVVQERLQLKRARENLTLCRRDVRKLITAALEEGIAGDWDALDAAYRRIVQRIPRDPGLQQLALLLQDMEDLRQQVFNVLDFQQNVQNMNGNADLNEQHKQNSKPDSIHELEPRFEKKQGAAAEVDNNRQNAWLTAFPLAMVLRACPQMADYTSGGMIGTWRDFLAAAVVVRSTLGISPSAFEEACEVMGPEAAAITIACMLERAGHIHSPGGYLRGLTAKARKGEFSVGPPLMALLRLNGRGERAVS
ncbi:plasmid replication protein RepC [Rhizobium paknamense]|nr:plasmid replication protein RepC [Rhizobium paknamense]